MLPGIYARIFYIPGCQLRVCIRVAYIIDGKGFSLVSRDNAYLSLHVRVAGLLAMATTSLVIATFSS